MKLIEELRGEFVNELAEVMCQKIAEHGLPEKILLTPREAAWSLGFTESAFNQSEWSRELPVVKIGIKKLYRKKDLETFTENRLTPGR